MTVRLAFAAAVSAAGLSLGTASAQSPVFVPAPEPTAPVMTVSATTPDSPGRARRFGRRTRAATPTTTVVGPTVVAPVVMPAIGTTAGVTEGVVQTSASEPVPASPPMAMPGDSKAAPAPVATAPVVVMTPTTTVVPDVTTAAPMASTERSRVRRGLLGRLRR